MDDIGDVEIIAPNFKRRLSGVTSTIIQIIPVQRALGWKIVTLGPGLPATLPHIGYCALLRLWGRPGNRPVRVWHARRNIEMLAAVVLRDIARMKLRLVFTSASQRRHSGWSKFLIRRMDAVIAVSDRTAAYLEVQSTTIMHGIDTGRFFPAADKAAARVALGLPPERKIAGCFGRVRHQKGTDLFVDSMISLLPQRPDWIAIIAGRATGVHRSFETGLKERVKAAGLADRILFVGEHTNIPDWYRALDLFIAPQRREGFGLTPLEAMATRIPVVATDAGAFPELLATGAQETGILIAANDLAAMTQAAAGFMDDPQRARLAGERGRNRATGRFSIEGEASRIGALYETLLENPHESASSLTR